MGYLDIQSREDIDGLMEKTLSAYFHTTVRVSDTYQKHSFILNPRINSIVYDKPSAAVKRMVRRGHVIQRSRLLHWASLVYLRMAFSKCGRFGCKYLVFDELPEHPEYLYIMPGNMKLKIFDLFHHTVSSVLKDGFDTATLNKERAVRLQPQWNFVPVLTMPAPNVCRETILDGCTLDRLPKAKFDTADKQVRRILSDIQQKGRATVSGVDYAQSLHLQIVDAVKRLRCDRAVQTAIDSLASYLVGRIEGEVTVAFSHGDFQKGNLFATTDGHVYVLDWDTHGIRSLGYDILTYFYSFRYRADYWLRIDNFLRDEGWESLSTHYYGVGAEKSTVLAVYLLEDILWTIQECVSTPERRPSQGLLRYANVNFYQEIQKRLG